MRIICTILTVALSISTALAATADFETKSAFSCPGEGQTDNGLSFNGFGCYYSNTDPADFPFVPNSTVMGLADFGNGRNFSLIAGGQFNLNSMDIALGTYTTPGSLVTITGLLNGALAHTLTINPLKTAFQNYTFGWFNIDRVNILLNQGGWEYIGLDNIRYNETDGTVPEPATLALMGLGFAGMAARRRKSV